VNRLYSKHKLWELRECLKNKSKETRKLDYHESRKKPRILSENIKFTEEI